MDEKYPLTYSVEYPDRALDRLDVLRIFTVIPIAIVLIFVSGATYSYARERRRPTAAAAGILIGAPC